MAGKAKEFSDTNEAGRKYKTPKRGAKDTSSSPRSRSRSSGESKQHRVDTEKVRKDLSSYRKRMLQAPGRAMGMTDD